MQVLVVRLGKKRQVDDLPASGFVQMVLGILHDTKIPAVQNPENH
jgi:hypothetical protein